MSHFYETTFIVTNSTPGNSYTLYSPDAESRYGLANGELNVSKDDILRYKLDMYGLDVGDAILLFHSQISNTFSTIARHSNPHVDKEAAEVLKSKLKTC